ncbi:MAG: TetR/AcrR family transcriptional regulator [Pseudomonadota bacterium]
MKKTRSRKSSTQARGRARRQALLGAARTLLSERTLNEIELSDVAALAGIPKSSAYYFYRDIYALYAELAALHDEELNAVFAAPLPRLANWEAIIGLLIDRAAAYFHENSSARQLMFGPQTPPDIKWVSRIADKTHSAVFERQIDQQLVLPGFPARDRVFFRAVEAADLMFGLSILEFDALTEEMVEEAKTMTCAYLRVYIPPALQRR